MPNLLSLNTYKRYKSCNSKPGVIALFLFFVIISPVLAQDFPVNTIPEDLKSTAKAVIRNKVSSLELISDNRAIFSETLVITILNDKGIDASKFVQPYDKFSKVRNISGRIYDADGARIGKIKSDEIDDYSAIGRGSVYSDTRVVYINPKQANTPFTMVYHYEIVYTDILDYPDFYLVPDFDIAVEHAEYSIVSKLKEGFRYREMNLPTGCKSQKEENQISWTFDRVPSIRNEMMGASLFDSSPGIKVAPNAFEMEGRKGNSSTWKDFGKWIYDLQEGLNQLDEDRREEILSMIKDETDTLNIIKTLYEYMQNNTRYVSIQIGIGGWQPFPAQTVDRLGYGDCKALTNYMQAIYNAVGIPSYYTLVYAGRSAQALIKDFPSNQFNHAILCVLNAKDTLWLECTSQRLPCGYQGSFTNDRDVLIITRDGGKLAHTPAFSEDGNKQQRNIQVQLQSNGNGVAEVHTLCTGSRYEEIFSLLHQDKTDQRKYVIKSISIPNFDLLDYKLVENRSMSPSIVEHLNLKLKQYAKHVGHKMLIRTNMMSVLEPMPYESHRRQSPIYIKQSRLEEDTINYQIPAGFKMNNIPPSKNITSDFGEYHSSVEPIEGGFQYIRKFHLFKGTYPPKDYEDFVDFTEEIANADKEQISLTTETFTPEAANVED